MENSEEKSSNTENEFVRLAKEEMWRPYGEARNSRLTELKNIFFPPINSSNG